MPRETLLYHLPSMLRTIKYIRVSEKKAKRKNGVQKFQQWCDVYMKGINLMKSGLSILIYWFIFVLMERFFCIGANIEVNQSFAETGIFWEIWDNTMAADTMALGVVRSSAVDVVTV